MVDNPNRARLTRRGLLIGGGAVVLLGGGAPIKDESGATIGAIGAAGDAPDNDEAIVLAAL